MKHAVLLGVSFLAVVLHIQYSAGLCTFPADLQGTWTTGRRGNITITDEFIFNFPIDDVGTFSFQCNTLYGSRYIVKTTTTFTYIDPFLFFSALICFDFSTIDTDLYYYYMGSKWSPSGRIYFVMNDGAWNASDVCFTEPEDYDLHSFEVMVRNGNFDGVKQSCPSSLRAYWAYNFNRGTGNLCPAERSLDTCQSTQVLFNYTQCDTPIAYSDSGLLYCLYSVVVGTETYVVLYNDDSSVDDSTTYRMACWAYSKSDGNLLMTQHPQVCGDFQNSTFVDMTVGAELLLFNKSVCFPTTPTDLTWLYITLGCVLGFLFIVGIIVCLYYFAKYKAKQKPFRGGLEPANMATNGHTFKLASGIPESDAPINVMHLLRKDVITPGGRDTPSSTFDVTVKTPPQIFNIREIDSYGPSPTRETPNLKKDYHILGGADQSDYGDLPMDDERSTKTPVMVLPLKTPGLALEEEDDDYDDDDDDELIMPTPGRSSLVSAKAGTLWEDPMCPATRLPGIVEDYAHPGNSSSRVGCAKPIANGVVTNITFLNEDGQPLPPRTPTPPDAVETIRDENSKLRVKLKRKSTLPPLPKADGKGRGLLGDTQEEPTRGEKNPERGEESNNMELVFTVPVLQPKLATGIGPAVSKSNNSKKGGKQPGALLKSRISHVENRRGEQEKRTTEFSPRRDKLDEKNTQTPRKDNRDKEKKQSQTPRKNKVEDLTKPGMEISFEVPQKKQSQKQSRPKSVAGTKDTKNSLPEVEETPRPSSSVRMTRIDIPDLSPPVQTNNSTTAGTEIIDSPPQSSQRSRQSSRSSKESSQPRKLWLDPVRPTDNVWGQMSSVWRQGQAWPDNK